jgi:hypothetical protein
MRARPTRTKAAALKGDTVADLDFDTNELLDQARGNQTAIWHLAARWAREKDGSVDAWASFVGGAFAPSWDPMGDDASARRVALQSALNMATTADMRPVEVTGDDSRAELLLEGPDDDSLDSFGATRDDLDRANAIVFRAIAERRGMTLESRRDDAGLHIVFAK